MKLEIIQEEDLIPVEVVAIAEDATEAPAHQVQVLKQRGQKIVTANFSPQVEAVVEVVDRLVPIRF